MPKLKPPPLRDELIIQSFKRQPGKIWGFVLVRCTYKDSARWTLFLAEVKKQTEATLEKNDLSTLAVVKEHLDWTVIEDEENLEGATMLQASHRFQEWKKNFTPRETGYPPSNMYPPRHGFYIYVNEESIESVLNPLRALEKTGNFLILVRLDVNLKPEGEDPGDDIYTLDDFSDEADDSFRLICANLIPSFYADNADTPNNWYIGANSVKGPPIVHGGWNSSWSSLMKEPDPIGLDVYLMLKQIYGEGNFRSECFTSDEAQTDLQRMRGYDGGTWMNTFFPDWRNWKWSGGKSAR